MAALAVAVALPLARMGAPTPASSAGNNTTAPASSARNNTSAPASSGATGGPGGQVPLCQPADLRLAPGPPISAMTGENALSYALQNTTSKACLLFGVPHVELVSAQGVQLPFHYTRKATQYLPVQHPRRVVLSPGGAPASLLVVKYRCDQGMATAVAGIRISIGSGTLSEPVHDIGFAYCIGGQNDPGQTVAVSAFTSMR